MYHPPAGQQDHGPPLKRHRRFHGLLQPHDVRNVSNGHFWRGWQLFWERLPFAGVGRQLLGTCQRRRVRTAALRCATIAGYPYPYYPMSINRHMA